MICYNGKNFELKYLLCLAMIFSYMAFILYQVVILPVWYDEAITLLDIAGNPIPKWPSGIHSTSEVLSVFSGTGEIKDIPNILIKTDVHPPVYYVIANIWAQLFGNNIVAVRSLSVLMSGAAMFLIWGTFYQKSADRKAAFLGSSVALLFMIASPTFAYVTLNARGYSVAMFLVVAVIFLAHLQINEKARNQKKVFILLTGTGMLSALAFLTNYMTIFATGPVLLFLALRNIRQHVALVVFSAVITVGVASLSFPFLAEQMGARPNQFAGFSSLGKEVFSVFIGLTRQIGEFSGANSASRFAFICGVSILTFVLAGGVLRLKNPLVSMHLLVLLCYIVGILVLFWKSDKTLLHGASPRYLSFIVPSFAIIIGQMIKSFTAQRLAAGIISALIAMCFLNTWVIQGGPNSDPWTTKPFVDRLQEAFEVNSPEKNMVIFTTRARGNISVPMLSINSETQVGFVVSEGDVDNVFNVAKTKSTILYVKNSNNEIYSRISSELIKNLKSAGFQSEDGVIWTRHAE